MNINGEELILLIIIAVIVIGPERLPTYAEQLGQLVRNLKKMATGATERVKEELGEEAEDLDLSQFDPRKYDPRRIVREALTDDVLPASRPARPARTTGSRPVSSVRSSTANRRPGQSGQAGRRNAVGTQHKADDGARATVTNAGTAAVTEGKTEVSTPRSESATAAGSVAVAGAAGLATNGKPEAGQDTPGSDHAEQSVSAGATVPDDPLSQEPPATPDTSPEAEELVPAGAPFDDEAT